MSIIIFLYYIFIMDEINQTKYYIDIQYYTKKITLLQYNFKNIVNGLKI